MSEPETFSTGDAGHGRSKGKDRSEGHWQMLRKLRAYLKGKDADAAAKVFDASSNGRKARNRAKKENDLANQRKRSNKRKA